MDGSLIGKITRWRLVRSIETEANRISTWPGSLSAAGNARGEPVVVCNTGVSTSACWFLYNVMNRILVLNKAIKKSLLPVKNEFNQFLPI
jgi:hypothetical protein